MGLAISVLDGYAGVYDEGIEDMGLCECDVDFRCENHDVEAEQRFWAGIIGLKPLPVDVANAYDVSDYKGRLWEGWDAA